MFYRNPAAVRSIYPNELKTVMSIAKAQESRQWISSWKGLNREATPLYTLPGLAAHLGVSQVYVKDESVRSELGSFKALGAPIALVRLILRRWPEQNFDPVGLFQGWYTSELLNFTVISATDGNHGKGLAAAARTIGCKCVIVLHANVSTEREEAIAKYGARIVRIAGNYDESVAEAARLAEDNNWEVVSDTSYEGYEEIPRDVMQGYGVISAEVVEATSSTSNKECPFTHVVLQGGVGGMAAGISSYFWEQYGVNRPQIIIAEPEQADCLYQSAIVGTPAKATGSVDSVMAGLACGETSPLAWRFLHNSADYFLTIQDSDAIEAMRIFAEGRYGDIPIVAGESGAAGLAALKALIKCPDLAVKAHLNKESRILLINTEGATAPSLYEKLVGVTAETVQSRQQGWIEEVAT